MAKRKHKDVDIADGEHHEDSSCEDDGGEVEPPSEAEEEYSPSRKRPTAGLKKAWRDLVTTTSTKGGATSERLTENGGYAHTLDSKMKISKANRGNTPWNKGKQRSASDRAKIGAGVRARNRAILLAKLKKIGMTEEEWYAKKKQLKYLRERVRRAKKAKDDKALQEHQQKLQSALDEHSKVEHDLEPPLPPLHAEMEDPTLPEALEPTPEPVTAEHLPPDSEQPDNGPPDNGQPDIGPPDIGPPDSGPPPVRLTDFFARDVNFKAHPLDGTELENRYPTCPNGGPSGLICCAACTTTYSSFLKSTAKDIEEEKTRKVNKEVSELLGFLTAAKGTLQDAIRRSKPRTQSGPLHRPQHSKELPVLDTVPRQQTCMPTSAPKFSNDAQSGNNKVMPQLSNLQHENDQSQQSSEELGVQTMSSDSVSKLLDLGEPGQSPPSVCQTLDRPPQIACALRLLDLNDDARSEEEEFNSIEQVAV